MAANEGNSTNSHIEEILKVMREEILRFEEDLVPTVNQWTRDYYKAYEVIEKDLIATRRVMKLLQARISAAEQNEASTSNEQLQDSSQLATSPGFTRKSDLQNWLKDLSLAETMLLKRKKMYEDEIWPLVQPLDNRLSSKCTVDNLRQMLHADPDQFQQLWDSFPSTYDQYPDLLLESMKERHLALVNSEGSSETPQCGTSSSPSEFAAHDKSSNSASVVQGGSPLLLDNGGCQRNPDVFHGIANPRAQETTDHPNMLVASQPELEHHNSFIQCSSVSKTTSQETLLQSQSLFTTQSMTSSFHQHLLNQRGNSQSIQPVVSSVPFSTATPSFSSENLEFVDISRPPGYETSILSDQEVPQSASSESLVIDNNLMRVSKDSNFDAASINSSTVRRENNELFSNYEIQSSIAIDSGYRSNQEADPSSITIQQPSSSSSSSISAPGLTIASNECSVTSCSGDAAFVSSVVSQGAKLSSEVEVVPIEDPVSNSNEKRVVKIHKRTNTEIAIGTSVFAYRRQQRKWVKGQVFDLVNGPAGEDLFRVKYRGSGGSGCDQSFNQSKQIAFSTSSPRPTFSVGLRVLARFSIAVHEGEGSEESINAGGPTRLMAGVIGEVPMSSSTTDPKGNKCRYLVFFDTGEVQYIPHGAIFHLFTEQQSKDTAWEEITDREMSSFVRIYLHFYPQRPLLQRMCPGKWIRVKDYRRWHNVLITAVDSNLLKVRYEDGRQEWLFRGSDRIEIVKSHLMTMLKNKPFKTSSDLSGADCQTVKEAGKGRPVEQRGKQGQSPGRRRLMVILSSSSEDDELYSIASSSASDQSKSRGGSLSSVAVSLSGNEDSYSSTSPAQIAFKSSMIGAVPSAKSLAAENNKAKYSGAGENSRCFGGKKWETEFRPFKVSKYAVHYRCSPLCLKKSGPLDPAVLNRTKRCVLEIPLRYGFQRLFLTTKNPEYSNNSKGYKSKSTVVYKTPCGKSLRSVAELDEYLLITKCQIGIDLFSFDPDIQNVYDSVEHEFQPLIDDISGGAEKVPVRVVNSIDDGVPMFIGYIPERKPSREVERMMNTDPEFLICCDCTDNCRNKEKCRCCQLTIENTNLGRKNKKTHSHKKRKNYGYNHRKLTERLEFGMYECNAKCRCNLNTCYNRVVQHGLTVRLELFKTELKGWGVRSLDYIPGGTFICNYSGELLTDKSAHMGAKLTGDTYLMNLDFMEQVDEGKVLEEESDEEGYYMEEDEDEHTDPLLDTSLQKDKEKEKNNGAAVSSTTLGKASSNPISIDDEEVDESGISSSRSASEKTKNVVAVSTRPKESTPTVGDSTDDDTDTPNRSCTSDSTDGVLCLNEEEEGSLDRSGDYDDIQRASDDEDIEGILGLDLDKITASPGPSANTSDIIEPEREDQTPEQPVLLRSSGGRSRYRSDQPFAEDGAEILPSRKMLFQQTAPLVLDAMQYGNIGRFINHSCEPNLFVQNVFVDSHDPRFPYVGFFVGVLNQALNSDGIMAMKCLMLEEGSSVLFVIERGLGLVNLLAFLSFARQYRGLISSSGLSPVKTFQRKVLVACWEDGNLQKSRTWRQWFAVYCAFPSLTWLCSDDWFLAVLVYSGICSGFAIMINFYSKVFLFLSGISYLSLKTVSEPFLSLQMDANLIELDFLFFLGASFTSCYPYLQIVTLRFHIFRIMLACGLVKVFGSPCWRDLTAMCHHYYTQPLPNPLSSTFHAMPKWVHQLSTLMTFVIEIGLPFTFFGPLYLRLIGLLGCTGLLVMINVSGSYGFLGIMTGIVSLCLTDDSNWAFIISPSDIHVHNSIICKFLAMPGVIVMIFYNIICFAPLLQSSKHIEPPNVLNRWHQILRPFRLSNYYGKFGSMRTDRLELVIFATQDEENWIEVDFKYKPGRVDRPPRWITFGHLPRLDWRTWFLVSPASRKQTPPDWWFALLSGILTSNDQIIGLLDKSTYQFTDKEKPPLRLKTAIFKYTLMPPNYSKNLSEAVHDAAKEAKEPDKTNSIYWERKLVGFFGQEARRPSDALF